MKLSANFYKAADELFKKYPKKVHALLPLLHIIQKEQGFISSESIEELSQHIEVPVTHIQGVVTFYTMFSLEKMKRNYIGVCTNISCWLRGAKDFYVDLGELLKELKTKDENFEFHLEETECLGACGASPVVLCNETYIENADLQKIKDWCLKTNITNK